MQKKRSDLTWLPPLKQTTDAFTQWICFLLISFISNNQKPQKRAWHLFFCTQRQVGVIIVESVKFNHLIDRVNSLNDKGSHSEQWWTYTGSHMALLWLWCPHNLPFGPFKKQKTKQLSHYSHHSMKSAGVISSLSSATAERAAKIKPSRH